MVRVTEELALSPEHVTLYYASDPLMGHLPVLIFHGPSTTANYTLNSSRIQIHIYSPAGFVSFPRITVSPNSPFYSVVAHLPREFQGDEVCRGLAFGLYKYFSELPDAVKTYLKNAYSTRARRPGSAPAMFGEQHAADLAKAAVQAENTTEVVDILGDALQTQHIGCVDMDLVLPPGSIVPLGNADLEEVPEDEDDILDPTLRQYGGYNQIVKLFGEPVFLPTSKLRRAPSRPTSLNRSKSFSKNQKVELRMKMGELVDTEERYVLKLNELVNNIAVDFYKKAKERSAGSISPSEEEVERLFPKSAQAILEVNSAFMEELRRVMDESEEEAMKDMETPFPPTRLNSPNKAKDPSGALAMARLFLDWFPKFTECYQDYIRASQNFPKLLNNFLDQQSSFRQRVVQTGEQTIRSLLIEPVQRLPRYNLFIDQIVACLPITHPALQVLLRARDIITNICSMDDPLPDKPHVTHRLRTMVECWPADLEPQGRLILAVDFVELAAPYIDDDIPDRPGILLLFSDCVVILQKKGDSERTARDFLKEIDKPSPAGLLAAMTNAAGGQGSWEFAFTGWHSLADVRFTESIDGRLIWMTSTQEMKGAHAGEYFTSKAITTRCFLLREHYEGKANKWTEDIVKARIEGRFSEKEREDPAWTLRSVKMQDAQFGLHAAVFQEGAHQLIEGRREPAPIRVVLDIENGTKGAPVGHYGVEIVTEVRCGDMKRISMNTIGLNGKRFTDDIALEDFLPTLSRRIVQLLSSQFSVANPRLVPALVSYYTKVIRAINMAPKVEKASSRSFLSSSPVKMLSSFLSGNSSASSNGTDSTPVNGSKHRRTNSARMRSEREKERERERERERDREPTVLNSSVSSREHGIPRITMEEERPENPLVRLEQTFTGYVANMQARKGYFIGRTLLNRSMADELAINDLYNRLIEFPFDLEAAQELGTEVIFCAFEKFVRIAWREQIGPIMTMQALEALQIRASKKVVGDFADFVRFIFSDMAPQNRRAFTALIKLLADLLDGCSNDGDRGALTLAFAELLVDDDTAPNYINLLDRMVEDVDRIFEENHLSVTMQMLMNNRSFESLHATGRSHKSQSGSVTSNTSSLRRKFGFDTLLRQNSKNDERPSVWRTLSKHASKAPVPGESASLGKNSRSKSIDISLNFPTQGRLRRPASRDRPPIAGAFDDIEHRPGSSNRYLETIGEPHDEPTETKLVKKKRRSSLSDLKTLMAAANIDDPEEQLMPLRVSRQQTAEKFNSTPRPQSMVFSRVSTSPTKASPSRIPISPQPPSSSTSTFRSSRQKENDPILHHDIKTPSEKEGDGSEEDSGKTSYDRARARTIAISQIPTLKPNSRIPGATIFPPPLESPANVRPGTGTSSIPRTPSTPGQRLRLQSPQKLRERLQTEKKAIDEVDASLKSELSRIEEDMARLGGSSLPRSSTLDFRKLTLAVKTLEEKVPLALIELEQRKQQLEKDLEDTLRGMEMKVKAIDQLYKEATAENELLYEKFNGELGKIVKAIKGKGQEGKEELVGRLREQGEEMGRVKRENARLKREVVSLRGVLKGSVREGHQGGDT
ncbi:Putative Rho guanine nucleotide exchange factor gef2 [Podospora comata]|uniref:Rho guanine nucleotide exchange factor gef2 n=1 Tax=Podospora comata TaxID=48703 RepID=A0ABY6SGV9_PODCO|nr:Putative Rho guanine nucleotide exchange factor gef2 [Podospora comata]